MVAVIRKVHSVLFLLLMEAQLLMLHSQIIIDEVIVPIPLTRIPSRSQNLLNTPLILLEGEDSNL
jgi:hypothetical protein